MAGQSGRMPSVGHLPLQIAHPAQKRSHRLQQDRPKDILQAGRHPKIHGTGITETKNGMIMIHTLLNGESPEVIRYFRHLEYLAALWEKNKEKYRPILNGERYLTEAELSGLLKVTQRTLIEHRTNGKLPFYKFGGRILYKESDIIRILEQNRMEAFKTG